MTEQKSKMQAEWEREFPEDVWENLPDYGSYQWLWIKAWAACEASSAPILIAKLERLLRADKDRRQGERRDGKGAA